MTSRRRRRRKTLAPSLSSLPTTHPFQIGRIERGWQCGSRLRALAGSAPLRELRRRRGEEMSCAQKKRRERRRTESLGSVAVPVLGAHHATERLHSARVCRITMTRGSARCAARGWGCGAEFTATERRAKVNVDPNVSGVLYLLYTAVDVKLFSREKFGRPWSFLTGLAVNPSRPAVEGSHQAHPLTDLALLAHRWIT
jgi:hypothetical protein